MIPLCRPRNSQKVMRFVIDASAVVRVVVHVWHCPLCCCLCASSTTPVYTNTLLVPPALLSQSWSLVDTVPYHNGTLCLRSRSSVDCTRQFHNERLSLGTASSQPPQLKPTCPRPTCGFCCLCVCEKERKIEESESRKEKRDKPKWQIFCLHTFASEQRLVNHVQTLLLYLL